MNKVTCVAPINIAVIKYWGKSEAKNNIPLNSSVSVTIDVKDLCTKTTVTLKKDLKEDEVWLNGNFEDITNNKRMQRCLSEARSLTEKGDRKNWKCSIKSENNFPTAAGLASSASGYACLAKCLGEIYNLNIDLSTLARLGSGSACRSIHGGFVKWVKGTNRHDSKAVQIAPENHWNDLKCLILIVSNKQKSVPSTEGMARSVETSELLDYRVKYTIENRIKAMEKAIVDRDFKTFAELTMKDSNQLHAICQDTYPPIAPPYMNSVSHQIVKLISLYNTCGVKAAYTFDAGANAVIFTLEKNLKELLCILVKYFPPLKSEKHFINIPETQLEEISGKDVEVKGMSAQNIGDLQRIIVTQPGPGAHISVKDE